MQDLYTSENMAGEAYNVTDGSLSFTPSRLDIRVQPGGVKEGSFVVAGPAGMAVSGFVFSGSLHMSCERCHFTENPARISWRFDASALSDGKSVDSYLRILSNCGEYTLPFHAMAAVPNVQGRDIGELESRSSAAERLTRLAESDWHSAVRLFYRKDFAAALHTERERMLYRGLSQNPGNEQNVEEFLISACGVPPVEFSVETKEIHIELLLSRRSGREQPREYFLRILKKGPGHTNLEVTLPGGYMRPASARIEADDFIGDVCEFPYTVDPSKLHAGRNFGSIILKSPYQTIRIPVEIIYRRDSDPRAGKEREARHILVDLVRAWEKLHIHWALQAQSESAVQNHADSDKTRESKTRESFYTQEWLRQTGGYIQRLSYLDRGSILPRLYRIQLLLMDSRVHQAVLELEAVRRKLAGAEPGEVLEMGYSRYRGESDIEYCYRQFLTALAYNDPEGITPRVARLLRERYRRSSSDWRIAWMLLQLSPEYAPGTVSRWNFLKKQFLNGCRSPLIYLEAWDMIEADPGFLHLQEDRRSGRYGGDAFERQVLVYAQHRGLLDAGTMETVLELTEKRRNFSPTLFRVLTGSYEDDRMLPLRDKILKGICTMLIRGNITDSSCFVWYSRAVEREIGVVRLSEYYLQSMPEDYSGSIPESVIRSIFRSGYLIGAGKAYFYRYLYENRRNYPAIYAGCREDIRRFLKAQIAGHRMSQDLASLYTACLRDEDIRPDNAEELVRLSYLSLVRTTHMDMRRVVILYAQSSRERSYPMERGNCVLPVYGEDNLILLEDDRQCRYAASVPYTCDRMMQPIENAADVPAEEMSDLPFAMEISGVMAPDFAVTAQNLQNCEMLVRASGISAKYRLRLKLHLLRYYEETGEKVKMEQMLQTLNPLELEGDERTEVIGRMHRCGLDEPAAQWMLRLGVEGIPGELIADVCLGTWDFVLAKRRDAQEAMNEAGQRGVRRGSLSGDRVVTAAYRRENRAQLPDRIGDLAWESFLQGERRSALLELLLSEFDGLSGELEQIREAAAAEGEDLHGTAGKDSESVSANAGSSSGQLAMAAEDRIMRQGLFTGKIQKAGRILRQYRLGGEHRTLAEAALSQYCHYVFAGQREMAPDLMNLIGMMDRSAENPPTICKLAFLQTLSPAEVTRAEQITAQRFLASLMRDEIYFPFFRQLEGIVSDGNGIRTYDRETMIEYHSPAGTRNDRGHVVIHCALARGGKQEPFTAREMKEMYRGFYVSSFYLFFGEQIHYFITDDPEEKNIVESGTAGQDVRTDARGSDRFGRIDALSRSAAGSKRRETFEQLLSYKRQEYMVKALFGESRE